MPGHPLTRSEIAELAERLQALLVMIEGEDMSASTAMTYRLQGAVSALEAVVGRSHSLLDPLDRLDHRAGP